MKLKSVPADDVPNETTPLALFEMNALPAAFAVTVAALVKNGVAVELPLMFPLSDVRFSALVKIVPVMFALCKSLNDVRLVLAIGVVELPILAPISRVPNCAVRVIVAAGFVFPASIVPVVCSVDALVAMKLKSVPADDVPNETTPLALFEMNALPAAFAVTLAALVKNGVAVELPLMFPLRDVRFRALVKIVPVILALCRSLNAVRLVVPTGVVLFPIFAPIDREPA